MATLSPGACWRSNRLLGPQFSCRSTHRGNKERRPPPLRTWSPLTCIHVCHWCTQVRRPPRWIKREKTTVLSTHRHRKSEPRAVPSNTKAMQTDTAFALSTPWARTGKHRLSPAILAFDVHRNNEIPLAFSAPFSGTITSVDRVHRVTGQTAGSAKWPPFAASCPLRRPSPAAEHC